MGWYTGPAQPAESLPGLDGQRIRIRPVRKAVDAVGNGLDHVDDTVLDRQSVGAEIVMIVQGERLDPAAAEHDRLVVADRPRPGQHADVRGPFPQFEKLLALTGAEPEGVHEQDQRGLAEQLARERAGGGVLELAGQHVQVALGPRMLPQVMREDLGHRELVDLAGPAALGVLLPLAPVPARAQQQLAYVRRGGLHAGGHGRIFRHHLGRGLLVGEN